jgi:hypothetical protein
MQRKTPGKGIREEKRKDWSPNKRPHPKVQNAQWGALRIKKAVGNTWTPSRRPC